MAKFVSTLREALIDAQVDLEMQTNYIMTMVKNRPKGDGVLDTIRSQAIRIGAAVTVCKAQRNAVYVNDIIKEWVTISPFDTNICHRIFQFVHRTICFGCHDSLRITFASQRFNKNFKASCRGKMKHKVICPKRFEGTKYDLARSFNQLLVKEQEFFSPESESDIAEVAWEYFFGVDKKGKISFYVGCLFELGNECVSISVRVNYPLQEESLFDAFALVAYTKDNRVELDLSDEFMNANLLRLY